MKDARLTGAGRLELPIRSEFAMLGVATFMATALNIAFWRQLHAAVAPQSAYEYLFLAATLVLGVGLLTLFLGLFAIRPILKPVITLFLLVSSALAYFISEYGIVIDTMIKNIIETNAGETADLLTRKLALYVLALGVLPAALLWSCTILYRPFWQEVRFKLQSGLAVVAIIAVSAAPFAQNLASVFREHRLLLDAFVPLNVLTGVAEYGRKSMKAGDGARVPFAEDAHRAAAEPERRRKSLTVIVVGETARAANFSLNGYARETNPLLGKVPRLISYSQAFSCGTSTAQSLPCMFSGRGRASYARQQRVPQDGLLQILQRVGFSVLWRENQGGCVGVCKDIPTEVMAGAGSRALFELGKSLDENLLAGLPEKIAAMPGDAVVVLHMMGSHGPAYHKRYPAAFERFQPACKESQFSRCELSEIVNSYDNTIAYSDYVLAGLLEMLQARDATDGPSAMIYVSDHGELLGEGNLYLHGLPYAFAPNVQKHIPMLLWLSPKYQADTKIDVECLERHRHEPVSHDNLFHSVLGLLDVRTNVYDDKLDVFSRCRGVLAKVRAGN